MAAIASNDQELGASLTDCPAGRSAAVAKNAVTDLAGLWRGSLTKEDGTSAADVELLFGFAGELTALVRDNATLPAFTTSFVDRETTTAPGEPTTVIVRPLNSRVTCTEPSGNAFEIASAILCDVGDVEEGRTRLVQRLTLEVQPNEDFTMLAGRAVTANDGIASEGAGVSVGPTSGTHDVVLTRR